jgi:hypothetical protein
MLFIIFRYISVFFAAFLLSGCLGGSIATQIVGSIATRIADRAIANAMDVQDGPSNRKSNNNQAYNEANRQLISQNNSLQNNPLQNNYLSNNRTQLNATSNPAYQTTTQYSTPTDPYQTAFMNTAYEPVKAVSEPIPQDQAEEIETRIAITDGNQLVRVELFNLLIGDEKNAVFEKARLLGAASLPQKREWQRWGVGTGAFTIDGQKDKKMIIFLIPPEFGKLPSGSITMVELASPGELNVARYKGN